MKFKTIINSKTEKKFCKLFFRTENVIIKIVTGIHEDILKTTLYNIFNYKNYSSNDNFFKKHEII